MIASKRTSPWAQHRLHQLERTKASASMGEAFPVLKSLMVHLAFFGPDGLTQNTQVRYTVHVQHAKAVFTFVCQNRECAGGDYDLSHRLSQAVAERRKSAEGEVRCEGLRAKANEGKQPCHNLLRYKLLLGYV